MLTVLTIVDGKPGFHVKCFLVEGKKGLKIALSQMTDSTMAKKGKKPPWSEKH